MNYLRIREKNTKIEKTDVTVKKCPSILHSFYKKAHSNTSAEAPYFTVYIFHNTHFYTAIGDAPSFERYPGLQVVKSIWTSRSVNDQSYVKQ